MKDTLRVGDVIYGFCHGKFGRDDYATKRVEAIGSDWVVLRYIDGDGETGYGVTFYAGRPEDLLPYGVEPDYYGRYPSEVKS